MKDQKMNLTTIIIICTVAAGLFAITTAILQIIKQVEDAKESAKAAKISENKQKEISELQYQLLTHSNKVVQGQNEVIELQKELNDKNKKIEELQNTTLNTLTGGQSIPKLEILYNYQYGITVKVYNTANLPVRNVTIVIHRSIEDLWIGDNLEIRKSNDPNAFNAWEFDKGDIAKGAGKHVFNDKYENHYHNIYYSYNVRWFTGFYSGHFEILNEEGNIFEIKKSVIDDFTKGLKLDNTVFIFSQAVNVEPIKH